MLTGGPFGPPVLRSGPPVRGVGLYTCVYASAYPGKKLGYACIPWLWEQILLESREKLPEKNQKILKNRPKNRNISIASNLTSSPM